LSRPFIPDIASRNRNTRLFAERTAINAPIQGSAADMIKIAMLNIHRALGERRLAVETRRYAEELHATDIDRDGDTAYWLRAVIVGLRDGC
jgi:DNA polymerase-1